MNVKRYLHKKGQVIQLEKWKLDAATVPDLYIAQNLYVQAFFSQMQIAKHHILEIDYFSEWTRIHKFDNQLNLIYLQAWSFQIKEYNFYCDCLTYDPSLYKIALKH